MLNFKVGHCGCSIRSALLKLLVDNVLFGMMAGIGVLPEELDYRAKDLVIWTFTSIKYAQLLFHDAEQLFDISMFLAQDLDDFDHRILPRSALKVGTVE